MNTYTHIHQQQSMLIAEDDAADRMLFDRAAKSAGITQEFIFVEHGEALLEYLDTCGVDEDSPALPGLIVLDLNMPRMDGRETLATLRQDPRYKALPVVALTSSHSPEDVAAVYRLGANSYLTKPSLFDELVDMVQSLSNYWFTLVRHPSEGLS
ncbi:MAG: response regulator [Myxococcota bacterium]